MDVQLPGGRLTSAVMLVTVILKMRTLSHTGHMGGDD